MQVNKKKDYGKEEYNFAIQFHTIAVFSIGYIRLVVFFLPFSVLNGFYCGFNGLGSTNLQDPEKGKLFSSTEKTATELKRCLCDPAFPFSY